MVLSEKVCFEDAGEERMQQALHDQFKVANGYSDLEIAQKRAALENVMLPESAAAHCERLRQAGFRKSVSGFRRLTSALLSRIMSANRSRRRK